MGRVDLVCLVYLVHLVSFVQPNKLDKPNKPNKPDRPDEPDRPNAGGTNGQQSVDGLTLETQRRGFMPDNPLRRDTEADPTGTSSWLPNPWLAARQRHGSPGSARPRAAALSLSRARQAEVEVKVEQSPDFLFSAST